MLSRHLIVFYLFSCGLSPCFIWTSMNESQERLKVEAQLLLTANRKSYICRVDLPNNGWPWVALSRIARSLRYSWAFLSFKQALPQRSYQGLKSKKTPFVSRRTSCYGRRTTCLMRRTKFVLRLPHWASRPTKLATKQALIFTVTTYKSICML